VQSVVSTALPRAAPIHLASPSVGASFLMLSQALLQASQCSPVTCHRQEYPGTLGGNVGQLAVPQTLGRKLPAFGRGKMNQSAASDVVGGGLAIGLDVRLRMAPAREGRVAQIGALFEFGQCHPGLISDAGRVAVRTLAY